VLSGSFVLFNSNRDSWTVYDMEHATHRISPDSTYKIYDALLGLESGIITPEHSTFTWNGEPYPFNSWEADQDLTSAIHNSVNWYFQAIDSQAGFEAVRTFLQTINYGNQNTGTNLNLYWTDFSLKISPIEQVELLQDFYQNNFHFDSKNIYSWDFVQRSRTLSGIQLDLFHIISWRKYHPSARRAKAKSHGIPIRSLYLYPLGVLFAVCPHEFLVFVGGCGPDLVA